MKKILSTILIVFLWGNIVSAQFTTAPFITKWKTDNPGVSNDDQVKISTNPVYSYSYAVDWGDGNIDFALTGNATHTYAAAGTYEVKIYGEFPNFYNDNFSTDAKKLVEMVQWGDIEWESMYYAFSDCLNMVYTATDAPDLTLVTDMTRMFWQADNFNADLNNWDVSNVQIMRQTFGNADIFNGNIDNWDVSNVTDMHWMFTYSPLFNRDLSGWNVSNVQTMQSMFTGATSFDQSLATWNLTSATNMLYMLSITGLSTENYDNTLSGWANNENTPSGISIGTIGLVYCASKLDRQKLVSELGWSISGDALGCPFITTWKTDNTGSSNDDQVWIQIDPSLAGSYNYDVDWGDGTASEGLTDSETHTYNMAGTYTISILGDFPAMQFYSYASDAPKLLEINQWGSIEWESMNGMFYGCANMEILASDAPDLTLVTDMSDMFRNASSFSVDANSWDVSSVTNMSGMFRNASSFNGNVSSWDVSNVTDMSRMFQDASLFDQDISDWDVSKVTTMSLMLSNTDLSQHNYDRLLEKWSANTGLQNGVTLTATSLIYCAGATGRQKLINDFSWSIVDAGTYCPLIFSGSSIQENNDLGVEIGSFSFLDADPETTYSYSLVDSNNYPDNASFTIASDQLLAAESYDYETKDSYTIYVEVSDGMAIYRSEVTITITDQAVEKVIWNGTAWNNIVGPTDSDEVVIEGDFTGEFGCIDLQILSGVTLTVNGILRLNGDMYNYGELIVSSGSSLITHNYNIIEGDVTIIRNTRYADGKYSFVGSPVNQNASITGADLGSTVYRYDESVTPDVQSLGRWKDASADEMIPGRGYAQAFQEVISFTGKPNDGAINYTGTNVYGGWNLVSNPYPAAIDIDAFIDGNISTTGAVYLWDDNGSNSGRGSDADYIVANKSGATDSNGPDNENRWNGHIGSVQGFFVQLIGVANLTAFTEAMRVEDNNADANFFRKNEKVKPLLRLNLTSTDGLFKQALIGFNDEVADDVITSGYDAPVFNANADYGIYTFKVDNKLTIQTVTNHKEQISVGLNIGAVGSYHLSLQVENYDGSLLYLQDNFTGEIVDLTKGYDFISTSGQINDRFILVSASTILSLNNERQKIYASDKTLYINPSKPSAEYKITNLSGQVVMRKLVEGNTKIELIHLPTGIYLVSDGIETKKIILK